MVVVVWNAADLMADSVAWVVAAVLTSAYGFGQKFHAPSRVTFQWQGLLAADLWSCGFSEANANYREREILAAPMVLS